MKQRKDEGVIRDVGAQAEAFSASSVRGFYYNQGVNCESKKV